MAIYEGKKITMNVTAHTSEAAYADEVVYDNTESGLEATDVQAAIDELNSKSGEAENVSYDNTESGLEATDVQAAVDEVKAKVDTKADTDGSYEGMTVGNAEQLISKVGLSDKSPYLFRTAGGSLEIGNRSKVKKIIGASVPIIQAQNTLTSSWFVNDAQMSFDADKQEVSFKANVKDGNVNNYPQQILLTANHLWLVSVWIKGASTNIALRFNYVNHYVTQANVWERVNFIVQAGSGGTYGLWTLIDAGATPSADWSYAKGFNFIDLTQTFGTTVANRLYALEQAQAGTGIAKAKEILVKDYYPFNVTDFTHTKTSGKVNNGFNQLKTQPTLWTAIPSYDATKVTEVLPNVQYHIAFTQTGNGRLILFAWDENGNSLGDVFASNNPSRMGWYYNSAYGGMIWSGDYNFDSDDIIFSRKCNVLIQYRNFTTFDKCNMNLHWDGERDGEYEDYQEWNYPVEDVELKGILSLDAQDNWVADGDEYLPSGVIYRNSDELDLSTKTFVSGGSSQYYIGLSNAQTPANDNTKANLICDKYQVVARNQQGDVDKCIAIGSDGYLYVKDTSLSDASEITGNIEYELKDSAKYTEQGTPYTELQNDSNWGTEKWNDTRAVPMPVFSETEYLLDVLAKVEAAPESPTADGDYVMHRANGKNTYTSIASWLSSNGYAPNVVPTAPTTDGNYVLKCTIANGVATYSWEAQS